jgi:hypothetical protein
MLVRCGCDAQVSATEACAWRKLHVRLLGHGDEDNVSVEQHALSAKPLPFTRREQALHATPCRAAERISDTLHCTHTKENPRRSVVAPSRHSGSKSSYSRCCLARVICCCLKASSFSDIHSSCAISLPFVLSSRPSHVLAEMPTTLRVRYSFAS